MSLKNKISLYFSSFPVQKTLLISALLLAANAFLVNYSLSYQQFSSKIESRNQYFRALSNAASSQMGNFIHTQNEAAISSVASQLTSQADIEKVAIYQRDGQKLISKHSGSEQNEQLTSQQDSVVTNIYFDEKNIGYLIINFKKNLTQQPSSESGISQQQIIWAVAILLWLLLAIIFNAATIKHFINSLSSNKSAADEPINTIEKSLFQQLLKRNQRQREANQTNAYVVIQADWSQISAKKLNQLFHFFNRFLPHTGMQILGLKGPLLQLGISDDIDDKNFQNIHVLHTALGRQNLPNKILVHTLEFKSDVYATFFSVMDSGIWFEHIENTSFATQTDELIKIEINEFGEIELCKAKPVAGQQLALIERQSRFFLQQDQL